MQIWPHPYQYIGFFLLNILGDGRESHAKCNQQATACHTYSEGKANHVTMPCK